MAEQKRPGSPQEIRASFKALWHGLHPSKGRRQAKPGEGKKWPSYLLHKMTKIVYLSIDPV